MSEVELTLRRQMRDAIISENQLKQISVQYELEMLAASLEVEDVVKRTNMQEKAAHDKEMAERALVKEQIELMVSDMAEANRLSAEQKRLETEKQVALKEVQLITGQITQEQYDQFQITEQAKKLTELLPDQFERT